MDYLVLQSRRFFLASMAVKNSHLLAATPSRPQVYGLSFATAKDSDAKATRSPKKKKDKQRKAGKSARGAEEEREETTDTRLDRLMDACLDVPSPLRHVKMKERLREKEMEELGLMTKGRHREIEQAKARAKAKAKGEIEDADENLTVEEGRRLAKEYSRFLMRDLRKRQAGESLRLRLKLEAIAALPPHLRKAAEVPDFTPFPPVFPATLTPPIPDYSHKFQTKKKDSAEEF